MIWKFGQNNTKWKGPEKLEELWRKNPNCLDLTWVLRCFINIMRPQQCLLYSKIKYRICFDASKSSGKWAQTVQYVSKKHDCNGSHHCKEHFFEMFRKKMKPDSSKCAKSRTHHEQKTPQASQDFSSLQCEILLYCCIVDNPVGMNNYACKLIIASFSPGFARDWLWQPATNGVKSHREVDVEA